MNFRHDINGLRAVAVLAVVLFHFAPQWLPGGFAGVDVFFVISGFLMTSIIFSSVEKNNFSLFKFYNARANRIIPVLAAMSAVLLMFGWFYLVPTDYKDLGKQIEKSSLFISNILFSKGGGYFDTAEHTKWLLHTWSLSVEWQFYIFFPVIIIALKKYLSFTNLKRVVAGLFLASFIYCIYATYKDSKTAYFMLTSRAWEMLLGGIAYLYPLSFKNKSFQITAQFSGLVLILSSYFLISKDTLWPGYMALIPVFGAYLIIICNHQNNILLKNPIMGNIGKWSYSIYVWHWPLVVFGFYFNLNNWWACGIPLSILLGFLSYKFIENINFPRYPSWKDAYKVTPLYIFLLVFTSGYSVKKTNGFETHYPQFILDINDETKITNQYDCILDTYSGEYTQCVIGDSKNIKAIIVGDSHADAVLTAIGSNYNLNNNGILSLTRSGCQFTLGVKKANDRENICYQDNFKRLETINEYKSTPVFIVGRWTVNIFGESDAERIGANDLNPKLYERNRDKLLEDFSKDIERTICAIQHDRAKYILQPIPEMGFNVTKKLSRSILKGETNIDLSIDNKAYYEKNRELRNIIQNAAKKCGAKVLDPAAYLCKTGKCLAQYNGIPIYRDGDHLSEYGNKLLKPMFKEVLHP